MVMEEFWLVALRLTVYSNETLEKHVKVSAHCEIVLHLVPKAERTDTMVRHHLWKCFCDEFKRKDLDCV